MKLINIVEDYRFQETLRACCLDIQETDFKAKKSALFKMQRSGMRVDVSSLGPQGGSWGEGRIGGGGGLGGGGRGGMGGFGDLIVSQNGVEVRGS